MDAHGLLDGAATAETVAVMSLSWLALLSSVLAVFSFAFRVNSIVGDGQLGGCCFIK